MRVAINVMCIAGMLFVIFCLHGCANISPPFKSQDTHWTDNNEAILNACADAASQVTEDAATQAYIINKCVFEMGVTI